MNLIVYTGKRMKAGEGDWEVVKCKIKKEMWGIINPDKSYKDTYKIRAERIH